MKDNAAMKNMPNQVIIGLGVIGLGLLFLLDNLNIIDRRQVVQFWPLLFVIVGVVKLTLANNPNERMMFALIALFGAILTLNRMGFGIFTIGTFWPVLLIVGGGLVVYRALHGRREIGFSPKMSADSDSFVNITAVLGGVDRRITTPALVGGEITAFMGGCVLDLRGSSIEGEAVINVFALMGGITLKCPTDWTIVLEGIPILGGFDERTMTPPDNSKRLIIRGYGIMGGVEVRN